MGTIEKRSRIIIGILALVLILMFLGFSFGISNVFIIGMVTTGILLSLLIFAEVGIISYIKSGKYKSFDLGDLVVIFGAIVGAAVLVFSLSLIPVIGETLPEFIITFTGTFAKVISGIAVVAVLFFILTPRFD